VPILVKTLNDRILSALDAEGSERYTFDQDLKYSINESMEILITWCNRAFGEKKLSPESLRELVKIKVWQTSYYSRVAFNAKDVGHDFWTIFAVYPKIETNRGLSGTTLNNKSESKFRPDVSFISSLKSAKRRLYGISLWENGQARAVKLLLKPRKSQQKKSSKSTKTP
jgi:hypothetical protein